MENLRKAFHNAVTAVLTIRGAARAVAFYERASGAEEIYRNTYPDGRIVAELAVGEARFRVADEAPEAGNLSPEALGGTSKRYFTDVSYVYELTAPMETVIDMTERDRTEQFSAPLKPVR